MVALGNFLMGVFFLVFGVPAALNHPTVDRFNRVVKAAGTKQRASEIEMSALSVAVGRVVGTGIAIFGVLLVLESL